MSIECIKFTPVNKGSLVGYADLFVPKMGLEIFGCAFFSKDGRKWIAFPNKEYTNKEGEKKYISHLRFRDKEHMEGFTRAAVKEIEKVAGTPKVEPVPEFQDDLPF